MKKIFRNGLLTMMMTLISGQIFAQFTGSIPVIQGAPGNQVVVPIIAQASGVNAFNIGVKFDSAVLSYQSLNLAGTPLQGALVTSNLNGSQLQIAFVGNNLSVTDTLLKIVFTYNASGGVSQLIWNKEYTEFTGANSQAISANLTDGAFYSSAATATVSTTSGNAEICELGTAQFTITASNATSFQWQRSMDGGTSFSNLSNVAGITGANTASLAVANQSQTASGDYFQCIVSGVGAQVVSIAQRLKVNAVTGVSVTVVAVPAGSTCPGTSVTYSATPSSTVTNPFYQWRVNGSAAGNTATLVRNDLAAGDVVSCEITSATCISGTGNMNAQVTTLPTVYNVTGGGAFCVGDSGVQIGLSDSDTGVNYQLKLAGQAIGGLVAGTGQSLSFSTQAAVGTYTVDAINTSNCSNTMQGSATVSTNDLPVAEAGANATIFIGNSTQLQASGGISYNWSPITGLDATNIANPVATPTSTTTYFVTVSNIFGCTSVDSVVITVNSLPLVNAGSDTTVCIDAVSFNLSGSPAGGSWSGSGITSASLGTFDPALAGAGPRFAVYTVTDGINYTINDTVMITVNALPNVVFGSIGNFCVNASAVQLTTGSPMGGTYSGPGVSGGSFNPTAAGLGTHVLRYTYRDSATTGCSSFDSIIVVVEPLPAVDLPAFADVCLNGGNLTLTGGTPAGGSYSGTGVMAGVFNPATAGVGSYAIVYTYTDTITNCSASDTALIQVKAVPSINFPTLSAVCISQNAFALSSATPAGGTYSGTGVSNNQFVPQLAGIGSFVLTYTYTDSVTGCTNADTSVIVVNDVPVVTLDSLQAVCVSATPFSLTGGLPAGGVFSGVGVVNGIFNPFAAGPGTHQITYTYTDPITGCGGSAAKSITVRSGPGMQVTPSGATTFCVGGSVTLTATPVSATTYVWLRNNVVVVGANTNTLLVSQSGIYRIFGINSLSGCSDTSAAITITVNPLPGAAITAAGPTTFCAGSSVVLNAAPTSGMSYAWLLNGAIITGQANASLTVTASGAYRVVVTSTTTGCFDTSAAVTVTVNSVPTAGLTAAGTTSFCAGGSVVLNATPATGVTYAWLRNGVVVTGQTAASLTAAQSGAYRVIVTNPSSCFDTSVAVTVTVNPVPTAGLTATGPTTFCAGGSVVLNATPTSGVSYVWLRNGAVIAGQTTASLTASIAGAYRVLVSNPTSCFDTSAVVTVTVNPVPTAGLAAAGATTFCAGGSVVLNATPATGVTYVWLRDGAVVAGQSSSSLTASIAGAYRVLVTNTSSCFDTSAVVTVTVNAAPTAGLTAAGSTTFCAGGSVLLNATPATGVSYVWLRDGIVIASQTSASLTVSIAGAYRVLVTNTSSCFDTSAIVAVTVNAVPTAGLTAAGSTTICEGNSAQLNATPATGVTYAWLRNNVLVTGQTAATLSATQAGAYRVVVTNPSSCFDTSSAVTVTVNPLPAAPVIALSATSDTLFSSVATGNQWFLNGSAVAGATAQTLVITQNGVYRAVVTDANTCASDSSNIINVLNVSVDESFSLALNLYPNPTNGKAWISLALPSYGTLELEVLSTTGQRVHFEQHRDVSGRVQLEIDLPNVADGLYFVRVQQGAYSGMRRMMVRK